MQPLVLERLPAWLVLPMLGSVAGITGLLWQGRYALIIAGTHAALALLDWLSLALLPRLKRSFGPVTPPLVSLTILRALITTLIGLIGNRSEGALIAALLIQAGILIVSLYALWIEPFRLTVSRETLQSDRLDASAPPVRVLHLSDLHIERITARERRLQVLIEELAPDIIVFSGDFVNLSYPDDPETLAAIREVISQWQAPGGVFAVSGSPLVESQEMVGRFVRGTGIRWLRDEAVEVEVRGQRLTLIGITCAHDPEDDAARMRRVVQSVPEECFKLLIFHHPDIAPQASEAGVDLYLCGHTHGGQLRLPFYGALITSSTLGKRFEMGRYQVGKMTLYVSRGIGMEGASAPRARFLCPPEIILWTLAGCSKKA